MRFFYLPTSLLLGLLLCVTPASAAENDAAWTLLGSYDNTEMYISASGSEKGREFKIVTEVEAPLSDVYTIVRDIRSYPQWFGDCRDADILQTFSDSHILIYYAVGAPLPFSDRAMIADVRFFESSSSDVRVDINALKKYRCRRCETENSVQVTELAGVFYLHKIHANKTRVAYRMKVDMAGQMPDILADQFVKIQLLDIVDGLQARSRRICNAKGALPQAQTTPDRERFLVFRRPVR